MLYFHRHDATLIAAIAIIVALLVAMWLMICFQSRIPRLWLWCLSATSFVVMVFYLLVIVFYIIDPVRGTGGSRFEGWCYVIVAFLAADVAHIAGPGNTSFLRWVKKMLDEDRNES